MDDDTQRTDPNDVEALRSYHISPSWKVVKLKTPAEEIEDMVKGLRALCEGKLDCGCETTIGPKLVAITLCSDHGGWRGNIRWRLHPEITGATPALTYADGKRVKVGDTFTDGWLTAPDPVIRSVHPSEGFAISTVDVQWHREALAQCSLLHRLERNSFHHDGGGKRACEPDSDVPGQFGMIKQLLDAADGKLSAGRDDEPSDNIIALIRKWTPLTTERSRRHLTYALEKCAAHLIRMNDDAAVTELRAAIAYTRDALDGCGDAALKKMAQWQNLTGENGTNVNQDTIEQRLRNRRDRLGRQYDDVQARLTALDHDQEQRDREYRAAHGELTDDLRRIEAQRELVDAILAGTEGDEA